MSHYKTLHQQAIDSPSEFWLKIAQDNHWHKKPTIGVDTSKAPFNQWFPDGEINACYNAIDVHVENGRADQAAIIYDSPVTDTKRSITYHELRDEVARFAGGLKALGVNKGDRVLIYMPMIPEAIVAVLATARLGAVHSVVFGGFAANELAVRIDDCAPNVIVSASCGIEPSRTVEYKPLLDKACDIAKHKVDHCVVLQREQCVADLTQGRDVDWHSAIEDVESAECVPVASTDPLYILYTSGTTGQPKGVVRDTGGSVVSLNWSMPNIYNARPGDVYWAASDVGWVVGHSYIIYGPLFQGCTTVLYEGKPVGTPDAGAFWRVISEHKVKVLFTAPTAFRAIKKVDPEGKLIKNYDMSNLESLFLAGERCDPDTLHWAQKQLGVPVIDHYWQTETGWPICANCLGIEEFPVIAGSPSVAVPGYDVQVLDSEANEVKRGDHGALAVKQPLPPGTFTTLWNAPDRYRSAYFEKFPGYYETGDAGFINDDGYVFVMARTDDVINVAGHRLSTGAMEEVLAAHPDVAECAVMGVADELKGQLPVGLVILNDGCTRSNADVENDLINDVRQKIGPVAAFKSVTVVKRLPKTRSGKILRGTMRSIADDSDWNMPATIEDPDVLQEIAEALNRLGYANKG
ncbi:MAG: propionyl-CoA synthetase [Granulosicoccaceae bacterium]